jgi:hypothetical protein
MVQVGHPPRWFWSTAEAEEKHEDPCPLATESCFPFSDNICGADLASVGFSFKGTVGCKDDASPRLSTVMLLALAEGA